MLSLVVIWRMASVGALQLSWIELDWLWLCIAAIVYLANLFVRAWRLRVLFGRSRLGVRSGFAISCYFSVINFLIPARLGEVSLPWMIARQTGEKFTSAAAAVISIRFMELVAAAGIMLACLVLLPQELESIWFWTGLSAAALALAAVVIAVASLILWWGFIRTRVRGYEMALPAWMLSLGVMVLALLLTASICRALGISSALEVAPVIFLASLLIRFLPANGLASSGGLHAAWAVPLGLLGYGTSDALLLSLWAHFLITCLVVVLGLVGYFLSREKA